MTPLSNPRDLVLLQLAELLWIERTLAARPVPQVEDEELRRVLAEHHAQTQEHEVRVAQVFHDLGAEPVAARSAALAGLLAQHDEQDPKETKLRDVFEAGGAVRIEHLEVAVYDGLPALELLRRNQGEDADALDRLSRIGERLRAELRV